MHQEIAPDRDAYVAGRDLVQHFHLAESSAEPKSARIWGGVPARNPGFTGRESLLAAVGDALASGERAVVQALHGVGGVGKTQLATEFVHRHAAEYDIVWWLNSENATLLGEQFAALAAGLSCAPADAPLDQVRRAVLTELHDRDRWLLVFDNAEKPEDIVGWLPGGSGHVLITSRAHAWHEVAAPVDVDVMDRAESVALLLGRVPGLSEDNAYAVADAVGDLPLAVAQAADFMADTGMSAGEYAGLLRTRAVDLLREGCPAAYPTPLTAVIQLAFGRLRESDPSSAALAGICAFLAPEPVPSEWFPRAVAHLPDPLGEQAADAIAWRQVIARLQESSLVRVNPDGLLMHRLTQAIIREHLSREESARVRNAATKTLTDNRPDDEKLPANWPAWARMLPHLQALDPANSDDPDLRNLATDGALYLFRRGDARAAADLARYLYDRWRAKLGEDHLDTLSSANNLALALWELGELRAARELDEDTLARRRRLLGVDHSDTLKSASNLARDLHVLGEFWAARELYVDTLARYRRVLGVDHLDTLVTAHNLALVRYALGELRAVRAMYEDTLARYRRVLGVDHPDTQESARNLDEVLRELGEG